MEWLFIAVVIFALLVLTSGSGSGNKTEDELCDELELIRKDEMGNL